MALLAYPAPLQPPLGSAFLAWEPRRLPTWPGDRLGVVPTPLPFFPVDWFATEQPSKKGLPARRAHLPGSAQVSGGLQPGPPAALSVLVWDEDGAAWFSVHAVDSSSTWTARESFLSTQIHT